MHDIVYETKKVIIIMNLLNVLQNKKIENIIIRKLFGY
jgi:hypothetical protein